MAIVVAHPRETLLEPDTPEALIELALRERQQQRPSAPDGI